MHGRSSRLIPGEIFPGAGGELQTSAAHGLAAILIFRSSLVDQSMCLADQSIVERDKRQLGQCEPGFKAEGKVLNSS